MSDYSEKFLKAVAKADCSCRTWNHRLVMELYDWEDDLPEVYVYLYSTEASLWDRIRMAWRLLIYGREKFAELYMEPDDFFLWYGQLEFLANELRYIVNKGGRNEQPRRVDDG